MNYIPITLGITGHRDAIITEKHKQVFRDYLEELNVLYPNSPITLFSPLAIGADTEIAELFLEIKEIKKRNYSLIVPLPYEREQYINLQFENNVKHIEKFNNLLNKSEKVVELGKYNPSTENELYRNLGFFVADSSLLLFAFWDGIENNLIGGTADVVNYKITGSYKGDISGHLFDKNSIVFHFPVNRGGSTGKMEIDYPSLKIAEYLKKDKGLQKSLALIEKANVNLNTFTDKDYIDSFEYFYPIKDKLDGDNLLLRHSYATFDIATRKIKNKYLKTIDFFLGISLIFLIVFEVYKHIWLSIYTFIIAGIILSYAWVRYYFNKKEDNHHSFLEKRLISEGLRVQFYWNLFNIKENVSKYILRIHKNELSWLSNILNSIAGVTTSNQDVSNLKGIKVYWLQSQINFYTDRLNEFKKELSKWNENSKIAFNLAIFSFGLVGILTLAKHLEQVNLTTSHLNENSKTEINVESHQNVHSPVELLLHIMIVFDGVLFGIFGFYRAKIEMSGYEQLENQYILLNNVFSATLIEIEGIEKSNLSKVDKDEKISNLLILCGKEALIEHGNWYLIFKEKEPKPEVGG